MKNVIAIIKNAWLAKAQFGKRKIVKSHPFMAMNPTDAFCR